MYVGFHIFYIYDLSTHLIENELILVYVNKIAFPSPVSSTFHPVTVPLKFR